MGKTKALIATVINDRMQKTVIVRVVRMSKHPKYGRIQKKHNKFKVHDERGAAKIGDTVRIIETRPLSKEKRFRLLEIIKKSQLPHVEIKKEPIGENK
ncbi:MAG: 30S ribosomal protein S17 [Candidatus Omnitrophota bacterium]|jgi:small subunit ribosomal protein S17